MQYENTAAKKRPILFSELEGQDFVVATISSSINTGKIAPAYLFSGPRGCGKTSAARIFARSLNCEKGTSDKPCGICPSCIEILNGSSLDIIEIDGASNNSVDNVRQIKDEILFPPSTGKYKVYIIDEVHMLSGSAFNALLKTIEEPPSYIVFIFATTELHKVPATIRSRCQQFAFKLLSISIIKELLHKAAEELGIEVEDKALQWIAKESGGSMRDAYTLFDQIIAFSNADITLKQIIQKLGLADQEIILEIANQCARGQYRELLINIKALLENGTSPEQIVKELADHLHACLLIKNGIVDSELLGGDIDSFSKEILGAWESQRIETALGILFSLYRDFRFSLDIKFELELAIIKIASLSNRVSYSELKKSLEDLRQIISGQGSDKSEKFITAKLYDKSSEKFAKQKNDTVKLHLEENEVNIKNSDANSEKNSTDGIVSLVEKVFKGKRIDL